jgi:hypothetical protein
MTTVPDLEEYTVFDCVLNDDNYAGDKVERLPIRAAISDSASLSVSESERET